MKTLIVLENERKVQPFMIAELNIARSFYDKVIIITKELTSDLSTTKLDSSITHLQVMKKDRFLPFLSMLISWFSPSVLLLIFKAIRTFRFGFGFISNVCLYQIDSRALYNKAKSVIDKNEGAEIVVMSCWFYCDAMATALLKRKYPQIKAISLAHSFEIDPIKNTYVDLSFNDIKHKYLDMVYFISYKMRDIYNKATNNKYLQCPSSITYLGSMKKEEGFNPLTKEDNVFRLCSCSNVIPVKNLDLLVESLRLWNDGQIEWVHFGGGPLFEDIKRKVSLINNERVNVILKGNTPNDDVHRYFVNNQVDLFVNVSKSEGIPVSLMEAISYGIPILATDVGGSSEIIDESHGVLVNAKIKPSELVDTIRLFKKEYQQDPYMKRKSAHDFWSLKFNAQNNMKTFFQEINAFKI